ncbi:MAG: hypothetical protein GQ535_12905 [Rhodobacteraceae bacterium]|nr:hypothetical protein [Paracoccaceae bacterium]
MLLQPSGNLGGFVDTGGDGAAIDLSVSELSTAIVIGPAPASIAMGEMSTAIVIGPAPSHIALSELSTAIKEV